MQLCNLRGRIACCFVSTQKLDDLSARFSEANLEEKFVVNNAVCG